MKRKNLLITMLLAVAFALFTPPLNLVAQDAAPPSTDSLSIIESVTAENNVQATKLEKAQEVIVEVSNQLHLQVDTTADVGTLANQVLNEIKTHPVKGDSPASIIGWGLAILTTLLSAILLILRFADKKKKGGG